MTNDDRRYMNFRTWLVSAAFVMAFGAIGAKAFYLQIWRGEHLSQMAAKQYERSLDTHGKRGIIYDASMTELAVSIQVTSIAAHPAQIKDARRAARRIAKAIGLDARKLARRLASQKSFVWIKRQATPKEVQRIKNLKIEGIGFVPEYNRYYPNTHLAAQLIGFTGIDGNGLEGVEFYYDQYLRGGSGKVEFRTDALGQGFFSAENRLKDYSGRNIVLTIDRTVQFVAEKTVSDTVSRYGAKSGVAIVMRPQTGEVLAMAHYPFFNPNNFGQFSKRLWRNRAITDPFEPGSTLKVFSAAAAVETAGTSPNSIFFCENGAYRIADSVFHDLRSHGWLSLQQIIKYSSNIGAVKIGESVGADRLYHTLYSFGFGQRTGFDCPGETVGSLSHYDKWTSVDTAAIAFGHGVAVSPLQLITALSAIANQGVLMRPHILKSITDQNGRMLHEVQPQTVRRVVSEKTARTIVEILKTVITKGGTGARAALPGYTVAGKTGTAQKLDPEGTYSDNKYIASFFGFTPADDPAIAVLVVIDEPEIEYYGGIVAAPAFARIAQDTLLYMNVPPDKPRDWTRGVTVTKVQG